MRTCAIFVGAFVLATAAVALHAADGALDTSFGTGGKVRLAQASNDHVAWTPTGVAVQSTGKIVISGWKNNGFDHCFLVRLNTNGTLDTTFSNANNLPGGYAGFSSCKYFGVAVTPDDKIVAAGLNEGQTINSGLVSRFNADGTNDSTFAGGSAAAFLYPASGDPAIELSGLTFDLAGNIIVSGTYTRASGSSNFYLARVLADGSNYLYATYSFPGGATVHDIANDVAIDTDGSYFLVGTATSSAGDTDCALAHFKYNGVAIVLDATFGGSDPGITIARNYGGDNNDYCFSFAIQPPSGLLVLGGQSTAALGITWQVAAVTSQNPTGTNTQNTTQTFWYDQSTSPVSGQVDTIKKVLVQPYDHRIVMVGSGPNHASSPSTGYDFGVSRLFAPSVIDTSFGTNGFALYDVGSTSTSVNTNQIGGAVFDHGKLIIVGTAQDATAGTDIVAVRLKGFDGIFKNGFEGTFIVAF